MNTKLLQLESRLDEALQFFANPNDDDQNKSNITPGSIATAATTAAAAGAGGYGAYKLGQAVRNRMNPAVGGVGAQVGGALSSLGGDAVNAVKTGSSTAWNGVKNTVLPLWKKLAGQGVAAATHAASAKTGRILALSEKLDEVIGFMAPDEFKKRFGLTPNQLQMATKTGKYESPESKSNRRIASAGVLGVGAGAAGLAAYQHRGEIADFGRNAAHAVKGGATSAMHGAHNAILPAVNAASAHAQTAWTGTKGTFRAAKNNLGKGLIKVGRSMR